MDRRKFFKYSALASGTLLLPEFLKAFEALPGERGARKLILVQLSGGNDGLNTVIPMRSDIYYSMRSKVSISRKEAINLNNDQGFHPSLLPLKSFYDQGQVGILNSVGYPNPDRSHFRSMDIWHTASDANAYLQTGWIGRYLDSSCAGCELPYQAIETDSSISLALKGANRKGLAVQDVKRLYDLTNEPFFRSLIEQQQQNDNRAYLYKTLTETQNSASYIFEKTKTATTTATYPNTAFGKQLKNVATFIRSGLPTRVYYTSLGGFDTHVNQLENHAHLLTMYAEAVAAFLKDMNESGHGEEVLVMTFSEFGRRVAPNSSGGTDHGAANNIHLFGKGLKQKGILNPAPDLSDLEDGDLKHKLDFRSVYATILKNWLEVDPKLILGKSFPLQTWI